MSNWPTNPIGERRWRQQRGKSAETNFETFCKKNGIFCERLEDEPVTRKRILKNPEGKCPDFLCIKNGSQIVVEVKSHTLLTNEARNKAMKEIIQAKRAAGLSGTTIFGPFDPLPELKVPFRGYLRNASEKFRNIKQEYEFPRILLLDGVNRFDAHAVFLGAYPSFRRSGDYAGLSKEHKGLFDSTGSNVNALVYWDTDLKRYEGIENPRTKILLSEDDFRNFFEVLND